MTTGKVIDVAGIRVTLSLPDGITKRYDFANFDFDPMIGDTVDVFETESAPVIVKAGMAPAGGKNAW